MEWSLMDVELGLISLLQKGPIPQHQEFTWGDLLSKFTFFICVYVWLGT